MGDDIIKATKTSRPSGASFHFHCHRRLNVALPATKIDRPGQQVGSIRVGGWPVGAKAELAPGGGQSSRHPRRAATPDVAETHLAL